MVLLGCGASVGNCVKFLGRNVLQQGKSLHLNLFVVLKLLSCFLRPN